MIWRKLSRSRLRAILWKLQLSHPRTRLSLNNWQKPATCSSLTKRTKWRVSETQLTDSTLMPNMSQTMRLIRLFRSSIHRTWAGRPTRANCRSTTQSTDHTAMPLNEQLKAWPNSMLTSISRRTQTLKNSELKEVPTSIRLCKKPRAGSTNTKAQMKSPTQCYRSSTISETLTASTSLILWEIKVHVALATLFHLPRWSSRD